MYFKTSNSSSRSSSNSCSNSYSGDMKDKVAYKQPSSAENLKQPVKEVLVTEIIQAYLEYLISSKDARRKQTITLHVEEYTFIKFQILMYNAFGEKTHI